MYVLGITVIAGLYVVWNLLTTIAKYRQWCVASKQIAPLVPLHPIFGTLTRITNMESYYLCTMDLMQKTRAKMFQLWVMFFYPIFITCHPDTAKILLKSSAPKSKFDMSGVYKMMKPWLGDGLLLADGRKWERNRKLLTPAFHFDILRPYLAEYNDVADVFLKILEDKNSTGKSFDVQRLTANATLDTMLRCAFSYEGRIQEIGDKHPYGSSIKRIMSLALFRIAQPWYFSDFVYRLSSVGRQFHSDVKYVHTFAENVIKQRRQQLKEDAGLLKKKKKLDFLDILLTAKDENGVGLSDTDIRSEADTFLFAGYETTATTISWAFYCMGKYPEEQEKLYEEVTRVMGDDDDLKWEHIPLLKLQTMFLKEVMRYYPPIPTIGRYVTEPVVIDGVDIPAGTTLYISIQALHHHPDVWPEPEEFRPERFSEEEIRNRDPYAFIPFSAGTRNCIGQNFGLNEMKVIMSKVIKRYKIHLDPDHKVTVLPDIATRARRGIKVRLTHR